MTRFSTLRRLAPQRALLAAMMGLALLFASAASVSARGRTLGSMSVTSGCSPADEGAEDSYNADDAVA